MRRIDTMNNDLLLAKAYFSEEIVRVLIIGD